MDTEARSPADLAADLRRLGVATSDVVMVHASLRRIGPVEGGADGLIDAIRQAIGARGTMLMVLGSRNDWAWINRRSESERAALLEDADPFDHLHTPADPEVGTLAEIFRQRPETVVSDHPEGRFAAAGPVASELVSDVPWNDYFGPGSPLERFVGYRGKVLRLGADPDTVTLLHYAEYLAPVAAKRRVRRHRLVATPSEPRLTVIESLDDSEGIVDYPAEDYFAAVLRHYLAMGRARTGTVGGAVGELIDAADLVAFGSDWMGTHL